MRMRREAKPREEGKRALAHSVLVWILASLGASALASLVKKDIPYFAALGEISMSFSLILFALSWAGYLKKDGVRVFPRGAHPSPDRASTWADRVPVQGSPPLPQAPLPGSSGPESEDYRRLLDAEARLRERIRQSDEEGKSGDSGKEWIRAALSAAFFLLALALFLQYVAPLFAWR